MTQITKTLLAALAVLMSLVSGLPTPQGQGAETDFVLTEAEQPREGRVLISETPLDHTSFNVASVRLPHAGALQDDVVIVEAAEEADLGAGRFIADIPRDRNFGLVAGPRLPLPEDDLVVVEVADDKEGRALSSIPLDHSSPSQAGFRLPLDDDQEAVFRALEEDDFEIIEVGDYDYDGTGRDASLIPIDSSREGKAGFRLPVTRDYDDVVIVEAGPEEPRISTKVAADCLKPLARSRCRASLVNWFYNSVSGECEEFSFGGCDSDEHSNRFESREECEAVCLAD